MKGFNHFTDRFVVNLPRLLTVMVLGGLISAVMAGWQYSPGHFFGNVVGTAISEWAFWRDSWK